MTTMMIIYDDIYIIYDMVITRLAPIGPLTLLEAAGVVELSLEGSSTGERCAGQLRSIILKLK